MMGSMARLSIEAARPAAIRLTAGHAAVSRPANLAGPQQGSELRYGHAADAHTIARKTVAAVWPPGDDGRDLDHRIRAWGGHVGDGAELRDSDQPVGHILVEKTMIDSVRCLDPAVRLAVVEHAIGRAA